MTGPAPQRAGAPPCPRCGRAAPAGAGPFCPYCGRYLTALEWVAVPPDPASLPAAARPRPAPARRARYGGPPRYSDVPRWGLPPGPWRPGGEDDPPPTPVRQARALASQTTPLLLLAAGLCAFAAAAEVWRYVLLLQSRTEALSATVMNWSDTLVGLAGVLSLIAFAVCGTMVVVWSRLAMLAAADRSGTRPSRSGAAVVAGWLVPGINLVVPGTVLSEIEHAALELPADRRPSPSPLLRIWWVAWAASVVLAVVTALWMLRTGTQALADGVVLHAWLDALAVVTVLLTRRVVLHLTALLEPATGAPRELLVGPGAQRA